MLLGAHESIAGGPAKAFGRAQEDTAECLQIFTKNARGWKAKPLTHDEVAAFREQAASTGLPVIAHCTYLVNMASSDPSLRQKSIAGFTEELERCATLGIGSLVMHPGANPDLQQGISLLVKGIDQGLAAVPGPVQVLLENTAGQGNSFGHQFEHLARVLDGVRNPERVGLCLDTCHLYAAGHDFTSAKTYQALMKKVDTLIGIRKIKAFHLNDSLKPLGSHLDRHQEIGEGELGIKGFVCLLEDSRFAHSVGILETPNPEHYRKNLERLRSLRAASAC